MGVNITYLEDNSSFMEAKNEVIETYAERNELIKNFVERANQQ